MNGCYHEWQRVSLFELQQACSRRGGTWTIPNRDDAVGRVLARTPLRIEGHISTIHPRGTMVIEVRKHVSENLFVENESILFDYRRVAQQMSTIPSLGAVTFVAKRRDFSVSLRDLSIACGNEALSFVRRTLRETWQAWLFVSDGPWQSATRIRKYRKLWKNYPDLIAGDANVHMNNEVAMEAEGKVRYAGMLEIVDENYERAIDFARLNPAVLIMFSKHRDIDNEVFIEHVFRSAFPKSKGIEETRVDWMTLAVALCPQEYLLMRVSGCFDDREAAVDLIGSPQNIPDLQEDSSNSD